MRWFVFVPPLLGFVVILLAGWPGGISPDAANSINEGMIFHFGGHQEPVYGFVWAIALSFLPPPIAISIFFVLQVFAYWLAFALFAYALLRDHSPLMAVLAAVAGFLPPLFDFVVMVESNMQVGIAWTLAIALAYAFPTRRTLLACLPLIFYGFIARSGMIVVVAPVLFACFLLVQPAMPRKSAALRAVVSTAIFFAISWTVTMVVLGAPNRNHVLAVSELFDIAGVYQKTGTHCVPPSLVPKTRTAEAILAEYDPALVAFLIWNSKGGFALPESETDYASLKDCWIQTIQRHPKEYWQVKTRFARIFLMIGVDLAPATVPDYSANDDFGLAVPDNQLWTAIQKYVQQSSTTVVWKGWFWFSLTVIICILALLVAGPRAHAGLALYFGALCSLIPHFLLGQAALSRYYFLPYILCVACLLVLGPLLGPRARVRAVTG